MALRGYDAVSELTCERQRKAFADKHIRAGDTEEHIAFPCGVDLLRVIGFILLATRQAGVLARELGFIDPGEGPCRVLIEPLRLIQQPQGGGRCLLFRRNGGLTLRRVVDAAAPLRRECVGDLRAAEELSQNADVELTHDTDVIRNVVCIDQRMDIGQAQYWNRNVSYVCIRMQYFKRGRRWSCEHGRECRVLPTFQKNGVLESEALAVGKK